jgi:hypothetical protein
MQLQLIRVEKEVCAVLGESIDLGTVGCGKTVSEALINLAGELILEGIDEEVSSEILNDNSH